MSQTDFIGYMIGKHVSCSPCVAQKYGVTYEPTVRLYAVNVGQYGQRCHDCRLPLVMPQPGWPTNLFDEGDCPVCMGRATMCLRCKRAGGTEHAARVCIDPGNCSCACASACCDGVSKAPCNTCYAELGAG